MKNEIEDRKEFYDLLEHVFWAAQGEECRFERCKTYWEVDESCEGCNLYCSNLDGSHSCIAALINHYLYNNLPKERNEFDEY